jgi:3-hydroxyisobutyrate dehydrogenase
MSRTTVAVLGTGTMGAGMARNLAAADLTTRVWNRNPDRAAPLAAAGATVCQSVAEAVTGADVVVTMLWDADSVIETLHQGAGAFAPGAVLVQASTVGVQGAARVDEAAAELGLVHIDAPVLGTKQPAETGNLVVLASGPSVAQPVVTPVFEAVGARTIWVGDEAGAASRLKLVVNAFVLSLTASVAQSIGLARAFGLDPKSFIEAVTGGPMDNGYLQGKGAAMLAGVFPAAFGLDGAAKDASLILEGAQGGEVDLQLMQAVHDQFHRVLSAGHGDEDLSAVVRVHGSGD